MKLEDAVKNFIEYEEKGSYENWCEWDQHFLELKNAYLNHKMDDGSVISAIRSIEDYKEEK